MRIITDEFMTEDKIVSRSWVERLFSFTPMEKTKISTEPSRKCIVWGDKIVCHPAMVEEFRRLK